MHSLTSSLQRLILFERRDRTMLTMPLRKLASSLSTTTNSTKDNSASAQAPEKGKARNLNSPITLPRRSLAATKVVQKSVQRHPVTTKRAAILSRSLWSLPNLLNSRSNQFRRLMIQRVKAVALILAQQGETGIKTNPDLQSKKQSRLLTLEFQSTKTTSSR